MFLTHLLLLVKNSLSKEIIEIEGCFTTDACCSKHAERRYKGLSRQGAICFESDRAYLDATLETDVIFECIDVRRAEPKRSRSKAELAQVQYFRLSCPLSLYMLPHILQSWPLLADPKDDKIPYLDDPPTKNKWRHPRTKAICRLRHPTEELDILGLEKAMDLQGIFVAGITTFKKLYAYEICMQIYADRKMLKVYEERFKALAEGADSSICHCAKYDAKCAELMKKASEALDSMEVLQNAAPPNAESSGTVQCQDFDVAVKDHGSTSANSNTSETSQSEPEHL
ncbi:hypothetical protein MRB53_040908 [Persea americana]|nr:hypothetical protein MRB53_040908 [Persea americana]